MEKSTIHQDRLGTNASDSRKRGRILSHGGVSWGVSFSHCSDEAIIFVNFDSDETAPQFVFHGAVDLQAQRSAAATAAAASRDQSGAGGWDGAAAHVQELSEDKGKDEKDEKEEVGEGERGETLPSGVRRSLEVRVLVLIDRV